eukprot:COSAG02_NODE_13434_length_1395_cov_7.465278_1_plen_40_part_10
MIVYTGFLSSSLSDTGHKALCPVSAKFAQTRGKRIILIRM